MKKLLSGVKPTGIPTLGNYLGAMKQFAQLQSEMPDCEFLFFVADEHALTTPQNPKELKQNIKNVAALYLACGLKEENLTLFIQSEVPSHIQLSGIFESISYIGELERMTQYKEKKKKQIDGVSSALFTYPVLMAADILLYDVDYVPVGEDQKQHLELCKIIANRFNNRFGETFTIPQGITPKIGARIMDLQEPTKKMDKSSIDSKGCIYLLEPVSSAKKKIKSAVTDSEAIVKYDKTNKPGISNLMSIYSSITNFSYKKIEKLYQGKGYGDFKSDLAELVGNELKEIQTKYQEIISSEQLNIILNKGRERANFLGNKKIAKVYKKVGLGR